MSDGYAERRVLSILFRCPGPCDLEAGDFEFAWHSVIFHALNTFTEMALEDELKAYLLDLDENWAPENLPAFARMVKKNAAQRRFVEGVARLRK